MPFKYTYFDEDLNIAHEEGLEYSYVFVVKKWLEKGKLEALFKEFLLWNWGGFNYDEEECSSVCIARLLFQESLKHKRIDLFQKLWHKIIHTQNSDCKTYRSYVNTKNLQVAPGEDPEECRQEVQKALDQTVRLITINLKVYKNYCSELELRTDLEAADKALEIFSRGKIPNRVFTAKKLNPKNSEFVWAFGQKSYSNKNDFMKEFNTYNTEILGTSLKKDFTLFPSKKIVIKFMGVPEGEEDYDEDMKAEFVSAKPSIKFSDLMFFLNEYTYPYLNEADHIFYEGFDIEDDKGEIPVLALIQGS